MPKKPGKSRPVLLGGDQNEAFAPLVGAPTTQVLRV
jgi:hypothetical protein